jgi:hypothetical protein
MLGVERALFFLNVVAEVILVFRLIHYRLYRVYRSLLLYALIQAIAGLALLPVDRQSWLYLYSYLGVQTVSMFMALYVVQDLFRIALAEYPAIASFGKRAMFAAMALAAVAALAGVTLDATILPGHLATIQRFMTFERSMDFVILIFLLLISILLLWFPIKVRRNIVVYIAGFVLFAASRSFGILLANLLPQAALFTVSTILLAVTLLCLLFWTVGIRPEGERITATPGFRRDPAVSERLSRQLDAINAMLARFVRH